MRVGLSFTRAIGGANFPSFSEGLSLRGSPPTSKPCWNLNFPSFSEGLSLRVFDEAYNLPNEVEISLPFRRDFH